MPLVFGDLNLLNENLATRLGLDDRICYSSSLSTDGGAGSGRLDDATVRRGTSSR